MSPSDQDDEPTDEAADETLVDPPRGDSDSDWTEEDVMTTDEAPSFALPAAPGSRREPKPRAKSGSQSGAKIDVLEPGSRLDDFEIDGVLGEGTFGVVYLARQLSLDRQVALKVTQNQGHEGRTMAQLEHENIVQVFSESVSRDGSCRLLCMQFVPGTTLEAIIRGMHGEQTREWGGGSMLQLIDELNPEPPPFHPTALREREELETADSIEAICWIGARLAEALAYAHRRGVLHRDIKPANILQTRYGRPMLADFNLAFQPVDVSKGEVSLFGGTLAYMSPEHLDAFNPLKDATSDTVDERSDIYSLGLVLYELATGDVALPSWSQKTNNFQKLKVISDARKTLPPPIDNPGSASSRVFDRTIRKCLEPDPDRRYQDAADLAASLTGCKALREAEKELPAAGPVTRSALRRPFFWLVLLGVLPYMPIGSTVNIAYNSFRIVGRLSEPQREAFGELLVLYNLVLYPLCFVMLAYLVWPITSVWKSLHRDDASIEAIDQERVDAARKFTTRWPYWVVVLTCVGWMPSGVFFPTALHFRAGPVESWVFVHFLISCTLSGLIAMTYSYFSIQYLATRVFYPNLWGDAANLQATAAAELKGIRPCLNFFQRLAGLVPLVGAILVVSLGPDSESTLGVFQFLVITLIVLGFCGFELANSSSKLTNRTVAAMTRQRASGGTHAAGGISRSADGDGER